MTGTTEVKREGGSKKHICIGILAHVDAGKTTLSEAMLYTTGNIRKMGRVDSQDAFLDTYHLERERGITIFSKQAILHTERMDITLLDTPGHVDFSAEMERTLQVLDYAILVINGMDGVQGHTRTLWQLLGRYQVPVFLFVNKMDQQGTDREKLLQNLKENLSDMCTDFGTDDSVIGESAALCEESLLEQFLEQGKLEKEQIARLIRQRKLFPCYFGSALRLDGVEEFLKGLEEYTESPEYGTEFGAKVFKINRDTMGNRLTYLKVTGGSLKVREVLCDDQKVTQIRIYSGEKYESVEEAKAGTICAVTGLTGTAPGQGLGVEPSSGAPVLEPVLTYQILLPPDQSPVEMLPKLRQLEEEEPELHLVWDEELQELQAQVMGEVQIEILQSLIKERFDVSVHFGTGNIVYKETIVDTVEGIGHFEPLRHYAEVHLILEPGEPGSGMQFVADCREEELDKNWQRLILTHLEEREHKGVLTGSPLTDMRITVAGGRAHLKHTEGGDFRQATYRAVRQGLMQAQSVLLEPYYRFCLEIPAEYIGRAMTDLDQRGAKVLAPELLENGAVLKGEAPVSTMQDYQREVTAYSKGEGRLSCVVSGYGPCHNTQQVVAAKAYDPDSDLKNPSSSVFCSHGSGFYVEWDKVPEYMHVESVLKDRGQGENPYGIEPEEWENYTRQAYTREKAMEQGLVEDTRSGESWLGVEEIDTIIRQTSHANRKDSSTPHKGISGRARERRRQGKQAQVLEYGKTSAKPSVKREKYLLVDGYNVIFAWEELNELAKTNIDGARGRLMDILCDYQGMKKCHLIVVFDAYRVKGHPTEIFDYHNIHVVYTKEAETADQFIEKFAHENGKKYDVTVATSDGLEQIIIRGQGCALLSARDFEKEVEHLKKRLKEEYLEQQKDKGETIFDSLSEEKKKELGL